MLWALRRRLSFSFSATGGSGSRYRNRNPRRGVLHHDAIQGTRRKRLKRILLVAALLPAFCVGWYIVGRLTSPWRAIRVRSLPPAEMAGKVHAPAELRIAAYNIAHGRGLAASNWDGGDRDTRLARLRDIARLLKEARPDIVVLNEVDFRAVWSGHVNQAEFIAREAGFPHWVEQRNFELAFPFVSLSWGNAVLSRFPITDARVVDYPGYSAWEAVLAGKKRGALCTVEFSAGEEVRLLAVHLEHRSEATRVASARVIQRVRGESRLPLICAGDFNSSPVGYPLAGRDDSGQSALSLLLEGGGFNTLPKGSPGADDFTFPSVAPDRVIDWVLVPADWRIVSKYVLPVGHSDHTPVVVTVVSDNS